MAVMIVEVILVVVLWDWLAKDESGSATIRNVGLVIAGSLAIPLAIWRAVVADKQASSAQHQTAIAQQGLLNERYQKAAEMLGSDVLSVRIGGVHTLRDLAVEQPNQYHVRVMRLLCAFARNPTKGGTDWGELATSRMYSDVPFLMLREDLQAVMDVIRGRSNADVHLEEREGFSLQLQYADLRGATLHGADLRRAILWGADLSGAFLASTRLDCVRLNDARLSDAQFSNEGDDPAKGLTQQQLDEASGGPEAGPKLTGVLDAATGQPLVWRENRTRGIGDLPINNIDWTLRRSVSSAKEGATTLFCPSTSRILRRLRGFASPAGLRYGCSQPVGASAVIGRADRESLIGLTMQDLEFTRNNVNGVMEELLISVDRPTGTTQASSPTTAWPP